MRPLARTPETGFSAACQSSTPPLGTAGGRPGGTPRTTRFGARRPRTIPTLRNHSRSVHVARVQRSHFAYRIEPWDYSARGCLSTYKGSRRRAGLLQGASVEPRELLSQYVALRASALDAVVNCITLSPTGEVGFTGRADRLEDVNEPAPTPPQKGARGHRRVLQATPSRVIRPDSQSGKR